MGWWQWGGWGHGRGVRKKVRCWGSPDRVRKFERVNEEGWIYLFCWFQMESVEVLGFIGVCMCVSIPKKGSVYAAGCCKGISNQIWFNCYMSVRELGSTSFSAIPVTPSSFLSPLCHHHLFILLTVRYCLSSSLRLPSFILFFVTDLFRPYHVPSIIPRFCGWTILL